MKLKSLENFINYFFSSPVDRLSRWLHVAGILGLFILGGWLWGVFFNWGNLSFDFLDWAEITGPRYALLQDAATKGEIPLHAANTTALRGVTDRFFSIPDVPFLPEHLLLRYLNIGKFILFQILFYYLVSFVGLVLIYRRYKLSLFTFAILFFIFNFNGHITSHLAVGHLNWLGYFSLPYLVLLIFYLVEKQKAGWGWVLGFTLLQIFALGQGYFHLFVWNIILLAILAALNWRLFKPAVLGAVFSVLACLPRLLPPVLALARLRHVPMGGFSSVMDLFSAMLALRDPDHTVSEITDIFPLNAWETDYYIGLLGVALLIIFAVWLPLRAAHSKRTWETTILLTAFIFTVLSIGRVYETVFRLFPIPPFTGERVTSRMFVLPFIFLLVLAVIYLQRELERRRFSLVSGGVFFVLLGLLFHDLRQHLQAWRIRFLDGLVYLYPKVPFESSQHTIANHPDPVYINLLAGGSVIAAIALIFLIGMTARKRTR